MTVYELFEHFDQYFLEIIYEDITKNILDTYSAGKGSALLMNEHFLNEYSDFEVNEWTFNTCENSIYLKIEDVDNEQEYSC